MRPKNKMQITIGTMCIPKKEGPTYFQKYRYENKEKSTKDLSLESGALWQ